MYYKRGLIGVALSLIIIVCLFFVTQYTHSREAVAIMNPNDFIFRDSEAIYQGMDPESIVYFYVTVKNTADTTKDNVTFLDVNAASSSDETVRADVIIQEGDIYGPVRGMLGYGETVPNARITQRSFGNNERPQKSYNISLQERAGTWRGMTTIALNKHVNDSVRVRNKLAFDLLIDIPDITSTRTQFVRLFIKDETKEYPDTMYVDYGLFTQVETINKTWLRNRGLDYTGNLYKANNFNFENSPEIMLETNPLFNENNFNEILEIRGSNDHQKLINMLNSIQNEDIHINDIIEYFFDLDNYLTWLAVNILFGNFSTSTEDYFLYSPSNTTKFLFLPWGFSSSLRTLEREYQGRHIHHFNLGIANYWESPLHRRFLLEEDNRNLLTEKVDEVYTYLSPEIVNNQLNLYWDVISTYAFVMPDLMFLGNTPLMVEEYWGLIPQEFNKNYKYYKDSLVLPTPFRLNAPYIEDGNLYISWNESYSFFRDNINYSIAVNNDWNFDEPIFEVSNIEDLEVSLEALPDGIYYIKAFASDDLGNQRQASDFIRSADGYYLDGVKMFMITEGDRIIS